MKEDHDNFLFLDSLGKPGKKSIKHINIHKIALSNTNYITHFSVSNISINPINASLDQQACI